MKKTIFVTLCIAASMALSIQVGCSRMPTTADVMRGHASEAQDQVNLKNELAGEWEKGSMLLRNGEERVSTGEKLVRSAEKDLEDGREMIETGNEEIEEGRKLMRDSEYRFRTNFPGFDISTTEK